MKHLLKKDNFIKEVHGSYAGEWPMNKQQIGVDDGDVASNPDFARGENKFQEVQEYMKQILKPILAKKNANVEDADVEKVSDSFFNLGNNKAQEIKKMVDGCKDTMQCAQEIVNRYLKYVKINFNSKDNINDIQQDSVMSSESRVLNFYNFVINEGKAINAQVFPNLIRYNNEDFPNFNYPKRYIGKKHYKWRVLARVGDEVKPINFGDRRAPEKKLVNRLHKDFWETLPYYK